MQYWCSRRVAVLCSGIRHSDGAVDIFAVSIHGFKCQAADDGGFTELRTQENEYAMHLTRIATAANMDQEQNPFLVQYAEYRAYLKGLFTKEAVAQ